MRPDAGRMTCIRSEDEGLNLKCVLNEALSTMHRKRYLMDASDRFWPHQNEELAYSSAGFCTQLKSAFCSRGRLLEFHCFDLLPYGCRVYPCQARSWIAHANVSAVSGAMDRAGSGRASTGRPRWLLLFPNARWPPLEALRLNCDHGVPQLLQV